MKYDWLNSPAVGQEADFEIGMGVGRCATIGASDRQLLGLHSAHSQCLGSTVVQQSQTQLTTPTRGH